MKLRRSYSQQEVARVLRRIRTVETPQRRELDWDEVYQRLTDTRNALSETTQVDPEELERIWAHNAAQVAAAVTQEDVGDVLDLLLVTLGRETYGIDVSHIFKIEPADKITPVPRVPDWVSGVVNLRGRILSVVDLRRFFNLPDKTSIGNPAPSESTADMRYLVVVETADMEVALLADSVLDVKSLPANAIQDTSGVVRGIPSEYVHGVLNVANAPTQNGGTDMVVVLDLPTLLADDRLVIHEEIA
ncbi:MAG: chemotaxis protein CheW [Anaerolineae bacterium]|nr:chemotaxis protein CheW [Anaerolineae bacterium]